MNCNLSQESKHIPNVRAIHGADNALIIGCQKSVGPTNGASMISPIPKGRNDSFVRTLFGLVVNTVFVRVYEYVRSCHHADDYVCGRID